MQTRTQEVHTTDDGKEFTDLTLAMTHQSALENEVELDDYVATLTDPKTGEAVSERAMSRVRNDILKFLGWRELQADLKPVEAPKLEEKESKKAA